MPRFFLHLRDRDERVEDATGAEFPSLLAARAEAIKSAREIMAENLRLGLPLDHKQIEICDAQGQLIEEVRFSDVLKAIGE
jgi:hypothetical protein